MHLWVKKFGNVDLKNKKILLTYKRRTWDPVLLHWVHRQQYLRSCLQYFLNAYRLITVCEGLGQISMYNMWFWFTNLFFQRSIRKLTRTNYCKKEAPSNGCPRILIKNQHFQSLFLLKNHNITNIRTTRTAVSKNQDQVKIMKLERRLISSTHKKISQWFQGWNLIIILSLELNEEDQASDKSLVEIDDKIASGNFKFFEE